MKKFNNFHSLERKLFRGRLDHLLHPSGHIEEPPQLKGRIKPLSDMQDAFETSGTHPFIWGTRGIGKTSLGHTACVKFNKDVKLVAVVACGKVTSFRDLIDDILSDAASRHPNIFNGKRVTASLSAFGFTVSTDVAGIQSNRTELTVNQAASLVDTAFGFSTIGEKVPVVIVDEVDRLQSSDTFDQVSDLLKQLSVISSRVKFCFCGVTDDLGKIVGAHESAGRYIYGVELKPLSHDSIWAIVKDVECEFDVSFGRGQRVRISQIAAGYPHFAHLILKNSLLAAFEQKYKGASIEQELFREGLHRSAEQAATRLRTAYENAIRKGTDRYIEVLYAVANDEHMVRQFKSIATDYEKIMQSRPERDGYDTQKANGQDLRNALNSLTSRGFLKKGKSGWYQFHDPMLRSYVRLIADTDGVELSDETFPN